MKLMCGEPPFKRKFRWTFKGLNKKGKIIWPEVFIKLHSRPDTSFMAIDNEIIWLPSEIRLTHYLDSRKEFNEYYGKETKVVLVYLTCYDGCGNIVETWQLQEATVTLEQSDLEDDNYIVAEWKIVYKKSEVEPASFTLK